MSSNTDRLVRAASENGEIRAFAVYSGKTIETARSKHDTSPVVTAALGRLMSAGLMMGSMMKGEKDLITLKVEGSGPMKSMLVTADSKGHVKGYAANPNVDIPPNAKGKLDVASAVGVGLLTVIKDMGLKEPYSGTCELVTSEIAEDLTYYFASSEQTPSSVGLGVLVSKENTVSEAGGFIVQVMPDASDETISVVEKNLAEITSVTSMFEEGKTPEDIINILLEGLNPQILDSMPVEFRCDCSKERVERALSLLQKSDIQSMIDDGKDIEVKCHFCNSAYKFGVEELKEFVK